MFILLFLCQWVYTKTANLICVNLAGCIGQGRGQYIMESIMGQKYDLQTWFQKSCDTVYTQNIENVCIFFLIFCQLKTVDNIKRSDLINFDDFCYDIIWYYALVCLFLCFSSSSVFVPPCVFPCVSVSLCYLTCPFHSSLTSPVPDLLISVSVYLVFVLPALLSVTSIIRHPSASVLPVMFGSVSPSLSSYVPPIGMFGFWFLFSLVIWKMPFSLHLATHFFF